MMLQETYWYSKDKLPGTLSYPLKGSLLDATLEKAAVKSAVYSVRCIGRQNSPTILSSLFNPEPKSAQAGKSLITIWAVDRRQRQQAERILLADGLLLLCNWLQRAQKEGNVWRSFRHELTLAIDDGTLKHCET